TYNMKGGWPLYEDSFEDKYLTARLRLQLWTLRYEPSIKASPVAIKPSGKKHEINPGFYTIKN
ncbi:MAG: hypothetical protein J6R18_00090, partial [Kiritimatiellae bacterium]|nr:hypothetical protein [Kiritimatiellia bacterium]